MATATKKSSKNDLPGWLREEADRLGPIVSLRDAATLTTLSRTKVWELIKGGKFPQPILIEGSRKGILRHELIDWLADRVATRDGRAI